MKKVRLSKRGKIALSLFVIIVVAVGGFLYNQNSSKVVVEYYTVEKAPVMDYITSDGVIASEEIETIYAGINGEIKELSVDVGDVVKKGDQIGEIDSENIKLQIKGIDAQIKNVEYMLKEAMKPADRERVNSLEYAIDSARKSYERNKKQLEKNQVLYDDGVISKSELNVYADQQVILSNQLKSLQSDLALLKKSVSKNIEMQYNAQIENLMASRKQLENSLKETEVKAGKSGIVTEKFVDEGAYTMQGQPILEITNMDKVYILADVLESEVMELTPGQKVEVDDPIAKKKVEGTIDKIYPKVYTELTELGIKQKKVQVKVESKMLSTGYLLNQEIDVDFIVDERMSALRIPIDSYFVENDKNYVFVNDKGKAATKEVTIGIQGKDYVEVLKGLSEGEEIIEVLDNDIQKGMSLK